MNITWILLAFWHNIGGIICQLEQQAVQQGYKKVALLVDKTNVSAYQLRQNLGYESDSGLIICGYDFGLLSKYSFQLILSSCKCLCKPRIRISISLNNHQAGAW